MPFLKSSKYLLHTNIAGMKTEISLICLHGQHTAWNNNAYTHIWEKAKHNTTVTYPLNAPHKKENLHKMHMYMHDCATCTNSPLLSFVHSSCEFCFCATSLFSRTCLPIVESTGTRLMDKGLSCRWEEDRC